MGLADLHRHLDGSLRPATVVELAAALGVAVPPDLAFTPGMGLAAALARFRFTLSLLQTPESVRRVAREIADDAAAEGVTTLEVRFAPQLHRGAPLEAIVDAALDGLDGRAGLILCALYGEPPAVAASLVECARERRGVVGIDLAGGPAPDHEYHLSHYAEAFAAAGELGLGRTVHAGEGRPAAEIGQAIERLGAERIGHGTTLLEDPAVLDLVLDRGVVIEACPTSNVHTGVIASLDAHPLPRWLRLGVRATVAPDNTLLSAVDATEEHRRARSIPGMSDALMQRVIANGHAARFTRG
ncbi:MAG: adenosine deaminase family protein [Myxococcota bacterium]